MNLEVLHQISYGVYIVTSRMGNSINGQIANTVFQTTSEPPTLAISINKKNLTYEYITESGIFAVTILGKDAQLKLIGHFGFKCGRDVDKFKDVKYTTKNTVCPIILEHSLGYIEAKVINSLDVGTHTIFIGEIIAADVLEKGEPMTYEYYHKVKRGTTHKNAPTYHKGE